MSTFSIHRVQSIKLRETRGETTSCGEDLYWRDMVVKSEDGHVFLFTFFGEDIDNLKLQLKEV